MTETEVQPENKTPTFKHRQEVWVKATIIDKSIYGDNMWFTLVAGGDYDHIPEEEIRTTEQIVQEHGASSPQHNATKYEYTITHNGDFAVYKVMKYAATETEAIEERNRLNREAQHVTKQQTQEIILNEPDPTRKFKKGDKAQRRKTLEGRDLRKTCPQLPFDEILTVLEDENEAWNIKVKWGDKTAYGGFVYFELVEPAPEPKYWVKESTLCYYINYKGADDCIYTALYMNKDLYTLEEAQQECDRLNRERTKL